MTARSTGSGTARDARVGLDPQHARPLRVDREDGPAERVADQVPQDRPADAAGLLGRADDGDVLGREERLQAASPLGAEQAGGKIFCGLAARSAHSAVSLPKLPKISQYNVINTGKIPDHFGGQHAGATYGPPMQVACHGRTDLSAFRFVRKRTSAGVIPDMMRWQRLW